MPVELTERQKTILDAVIREYVARAEPVASADLVRKYHIPHSPATVRNELQALDDGGFVMQPHTSSGRVPTDQGYRFFIQNLATENRISNREEKAMAALRELTDPAEFIKQSSRLMAQLTKNFVLAGLPDEEFYYKSGLSDVMQEPEFSDLNLMHEFGVLVDEIEEEITRCFDFSEWNGPQTFIGRENPIPRARHCGMIISAWTAPFQEQSVIALIGPKRMNYEHNLAILRHFRQILTT